MLCFVYKLFLSLGRAAAIPVVEYMLFRSLFAAILDVVWCSPGVVGTPSILALRTLRGRLSREPPHIEDGAIARTEASVSNDLRLLRLLEEANVSIEALSDSRLLAVAIWYVVGCPDAPCGARCAGMAEAGDAVGNG